MKKINKIGVLTSGGDSPGMNAAVRAVVRTAIYNNIEAFGIYKGYQGLIDGKIEQFYSKSVANIIQRGGTILKSARCKEFFEYEGRLKAYENLKSHNIDALVAIGGDGTFTGAKIFIEEFDFPVIGLPGTIDSDLFGTDFTIGYDTAINTVVEAVDKIRDTADSHGRLFIIEVMGRDAGFIALRSGIATGAEKILIPESPTYIDNLIRVLKHDIKRNKTSGIIMVAEGDDSGGAFEVAKKIKEHFEDIDTRISILGHIQRGGAPSAMDRFRASMMGWAAVEALLEGKRGVMVGIVNKAFAYTPFEKSIKHHLTIDPVLLEIAGILSI